MDLRYALAFLLVGFILSVNGQGEEILEDIPDDWYENVETIGDENATLSAAPEGWMEDACTDECSTYPEVCDTIINDFGETEDNANCTTKATCIANCMDKLME